MSSTDRIAILLAVMIMNLMACASNSSKAEGLQGKDIMAAKTIGEVLKEHTKELISLPGVVGTAQGLCDGQPCIKVYVIKKTPDLARKIPANYEGYLVMIEETGAIHALPENQD